MKKILLSLSLLLITLLVFSGCSLKSKTPSAEQILADYNARYSDTSYANFSKIEISSENDNGSLYIADVILTGEDEYAEYTLETDIYYSFDDKNGWTFLERDHGNVEDTLNNGRSEEDIKAWLLQNGNKYITTDKDISFVSSSFSSNGQEKVKIKWIEDNYDLYAEYEADMIFHYKKGYGWQFDFMNRTSEKYKISNMENTVWRYKNNYKNKYADFIIKSISEDGLCLTAEYDGKTYIGYTDDNKNLKGHPTYSFPKDGLITSATLYYATTKYFEEDDYRVNLYFNIPYGGYTSFDRVDK